MKYLKIIISILSVGIFLNSCMMMGMGMMHGRMSHSSNGKEAKIIKEITSNGVTITATFPNLKLNEPTIFTVKIVDAESKVPISEAGVLIKFEKIVESAETHSEHHEGHTQQQTLKNEIKMKESESGLYIAGKTFNEQGSYKIEISVTEKPGESFTKPIVISSVRNLSVGSHRSSDSSMMGMSTLGTTGIIVGLGMILMMSLMMGWRFFI